MRTADVITAAVVMLLGGVVLYDALRLGIGWGTDGPKSGFFPFWLALVMVVVSAAILIRAARRPDGAAFVSRQRLAPVLKVLAPAAGMVILTQAAGLYVASALYLGFYMRWVGRHDWRAVVALSVFVPVVTFLIFERWFLVPMPKGLLETWLGY
jgi:putative tricarboxylic transport membrane protein